MTLHYTLSITSFQKELMVDTKRRELEHIFQMNILQQQHEQVFDGSYIKSLTSSLQNHCPIENDLTSPTKSSFSSPEMLVTAASSFKSGSSSPNDLKNSTTLQQIQIQYHQIMSQMQLGLPSNPSITKSKQAKNDHVSTIESLVLIISN